MRPLLGTVALLAVWAAVGAADDRPKDSVAAANTRKKLKQKVTVDYKETRLRDVAADLQRQFDNRLSIKLDNEGGVSNNLTITYSAKDKPLEEVLDEMFAKNQLGYVIVSNPKDRRDGFLIIKRGRQRGYEEGEEPAKGKPAAEDKPAPSKPRAAKDKDKAGGAKAEDDADKAEQQAAAKLKLAKMLQKDGLVQKAKLRYQDIIKTFPNTKAAEEARTLLKGLEK